jgi:hypothetical protein
MKYDGVGKNKLVLRSDRLCGPYDGFDSMIKLGSLAVTANLFHVFEPLVNLIESTVHVLIKRVQATHVA